MSTRLRAADIAEPKPTFFQEANPGESIPGALWFQPSSSALFCWDGTTWVAVVNPGGGGTVTDKGTSTVLNGDDNVVVVSAPATAVSNIVVTAVDSAGSFFLIEVERGAGTFTIKLSAPTGADTDFSWIVVN